MVLIGVWALILAGLRLTKGNNLDLRLVPGVLALLLAAASFGPGGASGFSVMSQKAERRPGSGEIRLAMTKDDRMQVDSIFIDQAEFG